MSMVRWIFVAVIAMLIGFFVYVNVNNGVPEGLGVTDGVLAPCPEMPNCVSSQSSAEDAEHYVAPIIYRDEDIMTVQLEVEQFLLEGNDARIITSQLGYSHVEISSPSFGFKDDLELYFPKSDSVMHVRSASRVGYDDLGVNRQRVRQIRELLVD